jgi:hypothetical protein
MVSATEKDSDVRVWSWYLHKLEMGIIRPYLEG